jgi:NAD(P)-dependent dehydrogenase (short-subunit alcohol dehydrogenase family)
MSTSAPPPSPPRAALVTGASQRIGRAIAGKLAQSGYAVAIHANRSRAEADKLAGDLASAGVRVAVVGGDLADAAAAPMLVAAAATEVGPLTLLVNNASVFNADDLATLDRDRFDHHIAVNLRAPLLLAQAFAAQAPTGADASIVNVTDQRVLKPTPLMFSYALSKGALAVATVMMAQALAPKLRVNAVAPGPTLPSPRQDAAAFARQAAAVPLGRAVAPDEIAEAVVYLAGARSVTGVTLAVDGGQHVAWQTPDVWGISE